MKKFIFWLKKSFSSKRKYCGCICMTCEYFDRCSNDSSMIENWLFQEGVVEQYKDKVLKVAKQLVVSL